MKVSHECRTTFAGGENIFVKAARAAREAEQAETPEAEPTPEPEVRRSHGHIRQPRLLEHLSDGRPRSAHEVASELHGCPKSIGATLRRMTLSGIIKCVMRPVSGARALPIYSVWGEE